MKRSWVWSKNGPEMFSQPSAPPCAGGEILILNQLVMVGVWENLHSLGMIVLAAIKRKEIRLPLSTCNWIGIKEQRGWVIFDTHPGNHIYYFN